MEEEKNEIMHLLQKSFPNHTKNEIITRIFPFIQKFLDLKWFVEVNNDDEFVAHALLNEEHHRNSLIVYSDACKSLTVIRKDKV